MQLAQELQSQLVQILKSTNTGETTSKFSQQTKDFFDAIQSRPNSGQVIPLILYLYFFISLPGAPGT